VRRELQADLDSQIAKQKAAQQAAADAAAAAEKVGKAAAPVIDGVLDKLASTPQTFAQAIADAMQLSQDAIEQVGAAVLEEQAALAEALLSGKGIGAADLARMKAETAQQRQLDSAIEAIGKARGIDPALIRKQMDDANNAVTSARSRIVEATGSFSSDLSGRGLGTQIEQRQLDVLVQMDRKLAKIEKKEGGVFAVVFWTMITSALSTLAMMA
jgi:hypothetical protein